MERLTERPLEGEEAYLSCSKCGKADISECWDQLDCTQTAVDRLAAIENILGDDYDLDRLRELVELAKNIPHVCRFCVGCEMEPKDGHGCDEYDSFVFSTRYLRELVEADREERCFIPPAKIGDKVYHITTCKDFPQMLDGTMYDADGGMGTATGYYCPCELFETCPFPCDEDGYFDCDDYKNKAAIFEDVVTEIVIGDTIDYVRFKYSGNAEFEKFGNTVFLTREAAEAALKGEKDG